MPQRLLRRRPLCRIHLQHRTHKIPCLLRRCRHHIRKLEIGFTYPREEFREAGGVLKRGAGVEELEDDAAEGPDVDFLGVPAAFDDFGGEVL